MTINEAIDVLTKAKNRIGGNACLILSLTDSELPDTNVTSMSVIHDDYNAYVEVQAILSK